MRATEGIVNVARLSGVPVIPSSFGTTRGRNLSTWDRFLVAWPFGRGVIVWGDPITVDRDANPEAQEKARLQIEDGLNAVTAEADRQTARPLVEPAPQMEPATGDGGGQS
jgi:lysophospholipid acyltransferase (LPLAT)-like uncharacterized protein